MLFIFYMYFTGSLRTALFKEYQKFYQKTGLSNSQKWGSLKNIILIFASATSYITILSNGIVFCAENSN